MHALTGGNPFFVSEVLRAERRRAAGVRPRRGARPGRPAVARPDARCSTPPPSSASGSSPTCSHAVTGADVRGARRTRRRRPARRRRRGACGSATRSPAGRSSRRSARTPAAEMHRRILAELEQSGVDDDARLAHHAEGALDGDGDRPLRPARRRPVGRAGVPARGRDAVPPRVAVRRHRPAARAGRPPRRAGPRARRPRPVGASGRGAGGVGRAVARRGRAAARGRRAAAARRGLLPPVPGARGERTPSESALEVLEPLGPSRELAWALSRHGRRVHGQRAAGGVLRVRHARPRAGRRARACPTSPATRSTRSRASSTTAATAGTPGSGRRSTWPWTHGLHDQAGRGLREPAGHAHRRHALPGGRAVLPRGAGLLRRARPGHQRPLPGRWPGRGARAHRALGRGRGDLGGRRCSGDRSSPINRVTFLVPLGLARARRGLAGCGSPSTRPPRRPTRLGEPSYATMCRAARAEARWLAGDARRTRCAELELAAAHARPGALANARASPCCGGGSPARSGPRPTTCRRRTPPS